MNSHVRSIPPVHELQKHGKFTRLMSESGLSTATLTAYIKEVLQEIRGQLISGSWTGHAPESPAFIQEIFRRTEQRITKQYDYRLKRVINATGTLLHTNLGRARLSSAALDHMIRIAGSYSNLEYNLETGKRGSRHEHIEKWICDLTGAEAAMAVNNNAAAVFLILRALGREQEVIVSRGQLVEIGGSFRVSSIMEESGADLVEVGTTNKTRLSDYEHAVSEQTALIMKVHTSNFKIIGFTESVSTKELAGLARKKEIIFYEDLGSGVLFDLEQQGIGDEPLVTKVLEDGADLVSFSGDKLLGGPQAGIIAGKKMYIDQLKKHQLARVLRLDKMTLAALEATLVDYLKGNADKKNPLLTDLLTEGEELRKRADNLTSRLQEAGYSCVILKEASAIGGGTMPGVEIETFAAAIRHPSHSADELHLKLRLSDPPIIARIKQDKLLMDVRTMDQQDIEQAVQTLKSFI